MGEVHTPAQRRAAAAHHEAGHAVIAFLHGVTPRMVSVAEDSRGRLICNREALTPESETMIAMAGPASEYLYTNPDGREIPGFAEFLALHESLWTTDGKDAQKHSEPFQPEERNRFREQHWERTLQMLRSHWNSVEAVASRLLENESLTNRQI